MIGNFIVCSPFQERKTSGASWLGARFLLFYLRFQLEDIVQKCYPNVSLSLLLSHFASFVQMLLFLILVTLLTFLQKTERVDNWLIDEMLRAVSFFVLSIFYQLCRNQEPQSMLYFSNTAFKSISNFVKNFLNLNNSRMILGWWWSQKVFLASISHFHLIIS